MSNLSKERIAEFRKIVREEYGKELTDAEVFEITSGLVGYFGLLAKIHHKQTQEKKDMLST